MATPAWPSEPAEAHVVLTASAQALFGSCVSEDPWEPTSLSGLLLLYALDAYHGDMGDSAAAAPAFCGDRSGTIRLAVAERLPGGSEYLFEKDWLWTMPAVVLIIERAACRPMRLRHAFLGTDLSTDVASASRLIRRTLT